MPHVELPQAEFKVVMLGDTNVGKTSLVLRFAEGYYRESSRSPTVGAFFITKRVQTSNGITCKVQIWDTAGQEQFRKMAPMYYKTAAAAVLCYDVSNSQSFRVVNEILDELQPIMSANNIVIAIVATKNDLVDEPTTAELVPTGRAKELASSVGAIYIDTSARNDENVNLLFQQVAEQVLYVREKERINGTGDYDMSSIPVTPGASINEHGNVVKTNPHSGDVVGDVRHINQVNYSPEQTKEIKDLQSNGVTVEEDLAQHSAPLGMCMGPLMDCASSNKEESSMCTIS